MTGEETKLAPRTGVSDRGRQALVVTTVLTGLAAIVVAMRLYARLGLLKIMGREDWTIVVALVRQHGIVNCSVLTGPVLLPYISRTGHRT